MRCTCASLRAAFLHIIGFGYQRTLSPSIALQADLESYTPWTQNIDFSIHLELIEKTSRTFAFARVFLHLSDHAPSEWWISPFAQGGLGWATCDDAKETGSIWVVGASAAYAFLLADRVHIAIGLGAQFHTAHIASGSALQVSRASSPLSMRPSATHSKTQRG